MKIVQLQSACVTIIARSEEKLDRLTGFGDHQMDLQTIKVTSLAGLVTPEIFSPVQPTPLDTIVVATRNRETVDHIDRVAIQLLPGFTQQTEQSQEQIRIAVPATIEAALPQHVGNVAFRLEHSASFLQIPAIIQSRHDRSGHDFRIRHLTLRIISMVKRFQHIVTQAINCYNSGVHVFLRFVAVLSPSTLPETHGFFTSIAQGGNLGYLILSE